MKPLPYVTLHMIAQRAGRSLRTIQADVTRGLITAEPAIPGVRGKRIRGMHANNYLRLKFPEVQPFTQPD